MTGNGVKKTLKQIASIMANMVRQIKRLYHAEIYLKFPSDPPYTTADAPQQGLPAYSVADENILPQGSPQRVADKVSRTLENASKLLHDLALSISESPQVLANERP